MPDTETAEGGAASSLAQAIRARSRDYADRRKADAARAVSDIADAIRDNGTALHDKPHLRAFLDEAAAGVDDLAAGIGRRTLDEIVDEVQAAIRRRPRVAAAAAALAGFALYGLLAPSGPRPVPRSRALVPVDRPPARDL